MTQVMGSQIPSMNLVANTMEYSSPNTTKRLLDLLIYSLLDKASYSRLCISARTRALDAYSSPLASKHTRKYWQSATVAKVYIVLLAGHKAIKKAFALPFR